MLRLRQMSSKNPWLHTLVRGPDVYRTIKAPYPAVPYGLLSLSYMSYREMLAGTAVPHLSCSLNAQKTSEKRNRIIAKALFLYPRIFNFSTNFLYASMSILFR